MTLQYCEPMQAVVLIVFGLQDWSDISYAPDL